RPYRFHRATNRTFFELFDRKNDSRFYKSFKWVFYCNRAATGLAVGDTAIYHSLNPPHSDRQYAYTYIQWNKESPNSNNTFYPPLVKYIDNKRAAMNDAGGSREWLRMRLGETYLLAAEAAGRKGDFNLAATYINAIRQRASWKEGEAKMSQYWVEEGGAVNDKSSTYPLIEVKADDLKTNFVDFMLDERGRELLGEYMRWEDLVRCEKLYEYVTKYNPDAAPNIREYHKLRPIPQNHIDRLNPRGTNEEEQNPGYF
ncbi:MAG: RagB/SusD family nutrient uptake outer membrane protein, partial [Tannerella sp.]|nr:RagB/SusD family nutrient uptake outer membrane protein [Tannerella sp.]